MNSEESRLRTFRNWPSNAAVDARRIAKAGFYYMGQGLEVQCFSCGGRIAEWNYGDKVMRRHRAVDPRCPFVINPSLSGNVPILTDSNISPTNTVAHPDSSHQSQTPVIRSTSMDSHWWQSASEPHQYKSEAARLESFTNWPVPFIVSPERLAKAGFYYLQQGDRVKCAFCCGMVARWEAGDDPETEHRYHFPHCPFLNRSEVTENGHSAAADPRGIALRDATDNFNSLTNMRDLGVQCHRVPKHTRYATCESRLRTYTSWPKDITQKPEALAEAGFYYIGCGDQVRCFHCDGGLKLWDPSDEPWTEHARWFSDCGFIALVKGHDFIAEALQQRPNSSQHSETSCVGDHHTTISTSIHAVTEEELQGLMNTPEAIAALQVGLEASCVKVALRRRMQQTGSPFSSPDALIVAALDMQLEQENLPEDVQDNDDTWGTPPNSPTFGWARHANHPQLEESPVAPRTFDVLSSGGVDGDTSSEHWSTDEADDETIIGPQCRANQEPLSPAATTPPSTSGSCTEDIVHQSNDRNVSLEEENRRLKEARLCKVCMDNEVCVVFLPCGHLVTCVNCAHSLADCPLCRQPIKATVRTFLS